MQLQYQTARLNTPGLTARKPPSTRLGWLGNLGVGQKLSLIAFTFGIPLTILMSLLLSERQGQIKSTMNELYGLQKTVPLAATQSGIYLFVDGVINNDPKGVETGVKEANESLKVLEAQLMGRSADRLDSVKSDWEGLQLGAQDKFTMLNNFQIFIQSNQQQLIEDMLLDAGLSAESDPTLSSLVAANQRRLPEIAAQIQLVALYTSLLRANPSEPVLIQQTRRNMILGENALNAYEADLRRAYALRPGLETQVGAQNQKFISATRDALNKTGHALNNAAVPPTLVQNYSDSLNTARDAYTATITTMGGQMMARVKNGYLALAFELGTLALLLIGTFALLITLARSIIRPLNTLTRASQAVSDGNYSVYVPVRTNDELGVMTQTFNGAVAQLRQNQQKNEQERLEAEQLQHNIGEFLDVTMDIAEGDLTKRGKVTDDVLGNVVDSINLMTDELAQVLKTVQSTSASVQGGSETMRLTTEQIRQGALITVEEAQRAAQQARAMNSSITQMAAIAQATAESARRSLSAAEQGQSAVKGTLEGMHNIRQEVHTIATRIKTLGTRSQEIQEIVDTISHLSSQVNLLSLHASIEAAGAGEAGTRFSVVAEEIRQLADSSTEAAQRVASLVTNVQTEIQQVIISVEDGSREVEEGYRVAGEAGERLNEIGELAQVSAHFAQSISTATKTQVQTVQQMSGSVQQIAAVAQDSQHSVEQGRQAAEHLEQLAQALNTNLARFRLPS